MLQDTVWFLTWRRARQCSEAHICFCALLKRIVQLQVCFLTSQAVNEVSTSLRSKRGDFALFSQWSLGLPLPHRSGPSSSQEATFPLLHLSESYWLCHIQPMAHLPLPATLNAFSDIVPARREVVYTYQLTQTIPEHVGHAAMSPPASLLVYILHFKSGCGSLTRSGGYPITRKEVKYFCGVWGLVFFFCLFVFCPP